MGRPRKTLLREHYPLISELAGRGVSECNIAKALGMSHDTFARIKREDKHAAAALTEGKAVEHDALLNPLFEAATKGNIVAAMFLLKCRHGYREQVDLTPQNAVQITFQIPGALAPDQYTRLINQERT